MRQLLHPAHCARCDQRIASSFGKKTERLRSRRFTKSTPSNAKPRKHPAERFAPRQRLQPSAKSEELWPRSRPTPSRFCEGTRDREASFHQNRVRSGVHVFSTNSPRVYRASTAFGRGADRDDARDQYPPRVLKLWESRERNRNNPSARGFRSAWLDVTTQ